MIKNVKLAFLLILTFSLAACSSKSDVQKQRSEINDVVKSNQDSFLHCFKDQGDKLAGKILIWFIIETDGSVRSVTLKESTIDNPVIEQCMMKEVMSLKFKPKMSSKKIEITYPFTFKRIDTQ